MIEIKDLFNRGEGNLAVTTAVSWESEKNITWTYNDQLYMSNAVLIYIEVLPGERGIIDAVAQIKKEEERIIQYMVRDVTEHVFDAGVIHRHIYEGPCLIHVKDGAFMCELLTIFCAHKGVKISNPNTTDLKGAMTHILENTPLVRRCEEG